MGERRKVIETAEHDAKVHAGQCLSQNYRRRAVPPMSEVAPLVRRPVKIEPDQSYPRTWRSLIRTRDISQATVELNGQWARSSFAFKREISFSTSKLGKEPFAIVANPRTTGALALTAFSPVFRLRVLRPPISSFYLQTPEGLEKVGGCFSRQCAGNRTFGLKKLDANKVPVPPIDRQHWFDRLQRQVQEVEALRESAGADMEALLPAMLHGVFRELNGLLHLYFQSLTILSRKIAVNEPLERYSITPISSFEPSMLIVDSKGLERTYSTS